MYDRDWVTTSSRERLEVVREDVAGIRNLKDFHRALTKASEELPEYDISYAAARTYHVDGRTPPTDYLDRVSEVFDVELAWLTRGKGQPRHGMALADALAAEAFWNEQGRAFVGAVLDRLQVPGPRPDRIPPWAPLLAHLHLQFALDPDDVADAMRATLSACSAGDVVLDELGPYIAAMIPAFVSVSALIESRRRQQMDHLFKNTEE